MYSKLLKTTLIASCFFASAASETLASHKCKSGIVERAGVALVKKYPNSQPGLEYAVLVGIDANKTHPNNKNILYVNFFAGKCDKTDKFSSDAAARELFEETSMAVKINSSSLKSGSKGYGGYVYSGDFKPNGQNTKGKNYIQLFFLRDDSFSVAAISKAQDTAAHNKKLPHHFKEVKATCAIPLQDLLNSARQIAAFEAAGNYNAAKNPALYTFQTRGDGNGGNRQVVYMDKQYMRNLARDVKNFEAICYKISGGTVK